MKTRVYIEISYDVETASKGFDFVKRFVQENAGTYRVIGCGPEGFYGMQRNKKSKILKIVRKH